MLYWRRDPWEKLSILVPGQFRYNFCVYYGFSHLNATHTIYRDTDPNMTFVDFLIIVSIQSRYSSSRNLRLIYFRSSLQIFLSWSLLIKIILCKCKGPSWQQRHEWHRVKTRPKPFENGLIGVQSNILFM